MKRAKIIMPEVIANTEKFEITSKTKPTIANAATIPKMTMPDIILRTFGMCPFSKRW